MSTLRQKQSERERKERHARRRSKKRKWRPVSASVYLIPGTNLPP